MTQLAQGVRLPEAQEFWPLLEAGLNILNKLKPDSAAGRRWKRTLPSYQAEYQALWKLFELRLDALPRAFRQPL